MKLLLLMSMLLIISLNTGCVSYLSLSSSRDEIAQERIIASGDVNATRMMRSGIDPEQCLKAIPIENGFGFAVDVANMDAFMKHPWRQTGAAILDAGLLYGTYLGVDSLTGSDKDNGDDGNSGESTGNRNGTVVINNGGNNNNTTVTVTTGDDIAEGGSGGDNSNAGDTSTSN